MYPHVGIIDTVLFLIKKIIDMEHNSCFISINIFCDGDVERRGQTE